MEKSKAEQIRYAATQSQDIAYIARVTNSTPKYVKSVLNKKVKTKNPVPTPKLKNYIGFSRDHSGSMSSIGRAAAKDYNDALASVRENAKTSGIESVVSVVECGATHFAVVRRVIENIPVEYVKPMNGSDYHTEGGGTPLFDSVGELIEMFKNVKDANDKNTSFLIIVTTDGGENSSKKWSGYTIAEEIKRLTATDRWTFVFRVPRGQTRTIERYGIPIGNILEWDQTEHGVQESTIKTRSAFTNYYAGRVAGQSATMSFYKTDLSNVKPQEIRSSMKSITAEVRTWEVPSNMDGSQIRDFVQNKNSRFEKGCAFYQLTKPEREVQDYKVIVVRNNKSGAIYAGGDARDILGLPKHGTIKLVPGNHAGFDIFIQSTSVNRKLVGGTEVLYWENQK